MTETEYLNIPLKALLNTTQNQRKRTLFAVAVAKNTPNLMEDPLYSKTITAAEKFADNLITLKDFRKIAKKIARVRTKAFLTYRLNRYTVNADPILHNLVLASTTYWTTVVNTSYGSDFIPHAHTQYLPIFHDIFRNPYMKRQFILKTPQLTQIAQYMYNSNDFTDMPYLHDALLDVGITEPSILNHTKEPKHYKSCWLIDNILGK